MIPHFRSACRTFEIRRRPVLGAGSLEVRAAEVDKSYFISQGARFASAPAEDGAHLSLPALGSLALAQPRASQYEQSPNGSVLACPLASDDHETGGRLDVELVRG